MKKNSVFNLILLGDPTAGKATQAKRLVRRYPLREFDFGEWLRNLKSKSARKKFRMSERVEKGILAPTELAQMKFKEVIFKTPRSRGIFFNGNPKKFVEAKAMYKWFRDAGRPDPLVVYLSIPKREMLKRIEIRERTERRSDDRSSHVRNRMNYYARDIRAVVSFLKGKYRFKKISGLGTRDEVYKRLISHIERELARSN